MFASIIHACKTAIRLQCFVSLIALPLHSAWGLPLSLLGPLGNVLFNPILVLFLACAFLVFFLEIFGLPNGFLIAILEYLWQGWHTMLAMGGPAALCAIPALPLPFLLATTLLALLIAHLRTRRWWVQPALWTLLGSIVVFYGFLRLPHEQSFDVPCGHARVTVHQLSDGRCIAFDYGDRGSNPDAWVQYPLAKTLAQRCGAQHIATYVLLRSSPAALARATLLCSTGVVSTIVCTTHPYNSREIWRLKTVAAIYGVGVVVVKERCVVEGFDLHARRKGILELVAPIP